jgi:hypothetical protein
MDYNINFKYKSGGGTLSSGVTNIAGARQKAIKASEKINAISSTKTDNSINKIPSSNIKLSTNILKLNQSITMLNATIKNSPIGGRGGGGMPSGGGGGGGGGGGSGRDTSAGFGGMGASIPIAGAAIALTGFIIQKVNQIGNAYIEKTSQQAKSVGVGGFRYGEGMYNAAEMGAGMKAFGMSSGKFAPAKFVKPNEAAVKMGNIFGLSAEEALGQAGTFKRTGASIEKALYTGAGAGLETELPKLIQAMSSTLEEAVKNGVNTSDLAKDLGDDLTALTMATTTKSVEAAMKISRAGDVSKTKTEQGQIQNIEDLFLWKGAQEELLKSLNEITVNPLTGKSKREETLAYMQDRGFVNAEQKSALERTEKITEKDIRKVGGEELLNIATEDKISSMSGAKAARIIAGEYKKGGMSQNQAVMVSQAIGGMGKSLIPATLAEDIDLSETRKKGEEIITRKSAEVTGGISGIGVGFERTKENDILTYGYEFAQATVEMDKAMRTLAKEGIGMATSGIKTMGDMAMAAADGIKSMSNEIDKIKKQGLSKTLKNMFFD